MSRGGWYLVAAAVITWSILLGPLHGWAVGIDCALWGASPIGSCR